MSRHCDVQAAIQCVATVEGGGQFVCYRFKGGRNNNGAAPSAGRVRPAKQPALQSATACDVDNAFSVAVRRRSTTDYQAVARVCAIS